MNDDAIGDVFSRIVIGAILTTFLLATLGGMVRESVIVDSIAACTRQYRAVTTRADTLTVALHNDICKALLRAVEQETAK